MEHIDDSLGIEDLVRQAQQHLAERAATPERIRAALPTRAARRARRRRNGALGATGVAVAVVAAVAAPLLALHHPGPHPATAMQMGTPPSTAPASAAPLPAIAPIGLEYSPTWLPTGLKERIRRAPVGDATKEPYVGLARTWTRGAVGTDDNGGGTGLTLSVRKALGPDDPQANDGTAVTVNGKPGFVHGAKGGVKSYLEWRVDADTVLSLGQLRLGLSEQTMLKIAQSVRPDSDVHGLPLRLAWLPNGMSLHFSTVGGDSSTAWYAELDAEQVNGESPEVTKPKQPSPHPSIKHDQPGPPPPAAKLTGSPDPTIKQGPRSISVMLSPTTTAPAGGRTLTVGGHPARFAVRTDEAGLGLKYLVVELGGGKLLTVIGDSTTDDDLVGVAEHVELVTPADVSWIGH